ncbi:unnamed protein product [Chrysodeixis includens]|uniref:Transmembrane protein 208 n=1 Tax=Chrysodeixis includens TaxID=689277 RepID=A0A9P0BKQ2_CHRIL|nr:unnamed protein product [Chrysodeixis includens]
MPPPPKGKAPTKGAKQILVENTATVNFYRNMALGSTAFYGVISLGFYYDNFTWGIISLNVLVLLIYAACYHAMKYISRPTYSDNSQLVDPGLDLNMEGGMGEHVKDIVILSAITHVLAAVSNYFWFLLLLLPARAFWLLWTNVLGPWFFQEAPEDTEQDEKKRKKMERKMKRYQQ